MLVVQTFLSLQEYVPHLICFFSSALLLSDFILLLYEMFLTLYATSQGTPNHLQRFFEEEMPDTSEPSSEIRQVGAS